MKPQVTPLRAPLQLAGKLGVGGEGVSGGRRTPARRRADFHTVGVGTSPGAQNGGRVCLQGLPCSPGLQLSPGRRPGRREGEASGVLLSRHPFLHGHRGPARPGDRVEGAEVALPSRAWEVGSDSRHLQHRAHVLPGSSPCRSPPHTSQGQSCLWALPMNPLPGTQRHLVDAGQVTRRLWLPGDRSPEWGVAAGLLATGVQVPPKVRV